MAIHAPLLDNDFITPETFAKIMRPLSPGATVAGPDDLRVTRVSNTRLRISTGVAMVGGVYVENDAAADITVAAPTATRAEYVVGLRVNVEEGSVTALLLPATALQSVVTSGTPVAGSINRITGVMYDIMLAVYWHRIDGHGITDTRVWGGKAGPYIVSNGIIAADLALLDIPIDSTVVNEGVGVARRWRKTETGGESLQPLTLQRYDTTLNVYYRSSLVTLTAWQEDPVFVRIIGQFTGTTGGVLALNSPSFTAHPNRGVWQAGHVMAANGTGATLLTATQNTAALPNELTLTAAGTGTRVINLDLRIKGALN